MVERKKNLDPRIASLLGGLRWRIRAYVWLEGVSLALIWIGLTFWIGFALDYLPVLVGASEMPREARAVVLLVIAAVLAWILYRWVFRRMLVPLTNRSMALLLERQFRQFGDRLVTSVELNELPGHAEPFDPRMLEQTEDEARENTAGVRLRRVFDFAPLLRCGSLAAALLATVIVFYAVNRPAWALWVNRIYLLRDEPWPRSARIEVVGIELLGSEDAPQVPTETPLIPFDERQSVKVAKGSNVRLRVQADRAAAVIPDVCTMHYTTADGERGRVTMNRLRRSRGEFQQYAFNGKPLRGILSSVSFDVVGYDFRVRDFRIEVVDSPAVIAIELDCIFPEYLVDERLALWMPRTEPLTGATQLPRGTDVTIRVLTNKPLQRVDLYNPDTKELTTQQVQGDDAQRRQFEYRVPALADNLTLDVTLVDVDQVVTERPYRIFLTSIADEPPRVEIRLRGIGTAVTPDVLLPVEGVIMDDYAVDETWFDVELQRPGQEPEDAKTTRQSHYFAMGDGNTVDASIDFRALRSRETEPLELQPNDRLVFSVKGSDKYNLSGGPNIGSSDRYQLDVVTPDALLAILESREIGQRRRFEQIYEEMTQARDFLNRVQSTAPARGLEPGDVLDAADQPEQDRPDPERLAERNQALRLLRTQQAFQQGRKSGQELLGVAAAFRDIREELINNRVDTEDRKQRLKELIADPMQWVADTMFPEFDRRVERLEKVLAEAMNKQQFDPQVGNAEATTAVEQANDILAELEEILQQMLDLETFNELLDIVRQLIREQQELIEKTETERKQGLLRDLR
jgi:hypothetical protein